MIHFFFGSNAYQTKIALDALVAHTKEKYGEHAVEKVDGETLELNQLPDLLQGTMLFAPERLVIIRDASKNKTIWDVLGEKLQDVPESLQLVMVEAAPDKRTKTFKALQRVAEMHEVKELNEFEVAKWLVGEAARRGGKMKQSDAAMLVARTGTDQFRLSNEMDKLLAYGDTGQMAIEALVEQTPQANVFALLDAAMQKRPDTMQKLLVNAKSTEEPYMLFGLLSSQVLQLAALVYGETRNVDDIAKTLKMHPFPLKKLSVVARDTPKQEMNMIIENMALLDDHLKSSGLDPWLLLEQTLLKIATR